MRRIAVAGALCVLSGCSDYSFRSDTGSEDSLPAGIEVDPPELSFFGATDTRSPLTLRNTGDDVLEVRDVFLSGDAAFDLDLDGGFDLAPGEARAIDVWFRPVGAGDVFGELEVDSNAFDAPRVVVPLFGGAALPDLEISPSRIDLGDVALPCDQSADVTLRNRGTAAMVLDGLAIDGDAGFDVEGPVQWPLVLHAGESFDVTVRFRGTQPGAAAGALVVDPADGPSFSGVKLSASASGGEQRTDRFEAPDASGAQLLFLVDQSYSMRSEAEALGASFDDFMSRIVDVTDNWRIGVITHDDACFSGGMITSEMADAADRFADAVVDTYGSVMKTEQLLMLAEQALSQTDGEGCNAGFLDRSAPLHVVVVSDERDQSPRGWTWYRDGITAMLDAPEQLTLHAVVDRYTVCGAGQGGDGPWGYREFAEDTGGYVLDICASGWSGQMADVAESTVEALRRLELSSDDVDPSTIDVRIDSVGSEPAWTWDAATSSVNLTSAAPAGSEIAVSYGLVGSCPTP